LSDFYKSPAAVNHTGMLPEAKCHIKTQII